MPEPFATLKRWHKFYEKIYRVAALTLSAAIAVLMVFAIVENILLYIIGVVKIVVPFLVVAIFAMLYTAKRMREAWRSRKVARSMRL